MKGKRAFSLLSVLLMLALLAGISQAQDARPPSDSGVDTIQQPVASPLGTAFTYQGQLKSGDLPYSGTCDLRFKLYDASTGGNQVGPTRTKTSVPLDGGYFTVQLDFGGGAFAAGARWLNVEVCCPTGGCTYTPLTPRQAITAAPAAQSLVVPLTAQGNSASPLLSVTNSGTGDALSVNSAANNGLHVASAAGSGVQVDSAVNGVSVASASSIGVHVGSAPYGLWVGSAGTHGLYIASAGTHGVRIDHAGGSGVSVNSADGDGVNVGTAGSDGVHVGSAAGAGVQIDSAPYGLWVSSTGAHGVYIASAGLHGVRIDHAGASGVSVNSADGDGVSVGTAGAVGVNVGSAGTAGVNVGSAGSDGVYVASAVDDGLHVDQAGYDGVFVASAPIYGMEVASAGYNGLVVWSAGFYGAYADTAQANHQWGFITPDAIFAGSPLVGAGPSMIVAQSGDAAELLAGDLVVVSGTGAPFAGGDFPAPLVRRAVPGGAALAGVVYARFVAEEQAEPATSDRQAQPQSRLRVHTTEGAIASGEYLLVVVLGQAQVRASAAGAAITAGDLLTVADEGRAARLGSDYRPVSVIGTAMEGLDVAHGSGLIWVLVNPR